MMRTSHNQAGFTIMTLIILGASLFVLLAATLWGVHAGRVKARNAQRVADVTAIRKALRIYHDYNQKYPENSNGMPKDILSYLDGWPQAPSADGACTAAQNQYAYTQANNGESYRLTFCLSQPTGGYPAGYQELLP